MSALLPPKSEPHSETALPPHPSRTTAEHRERKRLSRKRARRAAKLRNLENTSIYVTHIPPATTESQLAAHFTKCGIILPNPETGKPRVKLYRNPDGSLKGDALITYAFRPSLDNAISILDGVPLRHATPPLVVREATFDHKAPPVPDGEEQTTKKPRLAITARHLVDEALSWSDEHQVQKGAPRIVILRNVFDPVSAQYDIIRDDMREGCEQCGQVEKITVFERNEDGAVAVKFSSVEASLKCINVMNGRWYDGRKLHAGFYDGHTNYTYRETDHERKQREQNWQDWINSDHAPPPQHSQDTPPKDSEETSPKDAEKTSPEDSEQASPNDSEQTSPKDSEDTSPKHSGDTSPKD